ncbi:hypothetical protein, partial [Joostella sp. CR20]|uniref:hypothetical protein n=1 Tax=Joostella sp. CR20 TaxID=2804312 RepID=UPI00313DCDB3
MQYFKHYYLIICLFFLCVINAQSTKFSDMEMIPPSPTAFSFSKYGDTQVNESMGLISPQIPIGTYEAGTISLPISMDYSGNGVKVDQAASWTGINWNLAAGGAITRQVRGEDDLIRLAKSKFYSWSDLQVMNIYGSSEDYREIESFIEHNSIDSEVDIFYFNFLNYSGSFYLIEKDGKFTAHVENSTIPLNIGVLDPEYGKYGLELLKRTIVIQTPDGVKYFFGGLNASEDSRSVYPEYYSDRRHVQTGFYLNKIQGLNGDEMYFEYGDYTSNLKTAITETYTKVVSQTGNCEEALNLGDSDMQILETLTHGKFLQRIYNNRNTFEVIFSSEEASLNVRYHYSRILNGIKIRDNIDPQKNLIDVDFIYYFPKDKNLNNKLKAERFFLKEVNFKSKEGNKSYKMEYKDLELLPNRFSYAQDHLGYYNGKKNYRILPKVDDYAFRNVVSLADRSPDFNYASIGALSKLYYPTKGYSEFEYEPPLGDQQIKEYKTHTTLMYYNDYTKTPKNKNPASSTLAPLIVGGSSISCTEEPYISSQEMTIEIRDVFATQKLLHSTIFRLKIYDQLTMNVIYEKNFSYNSAKDVVQLNNPYYAQSGGVIYRYPNKEFTFSYKEGKQYSISLEVIPSTTDRNAVVNAGIRRAYYITYPYPCMVDGAGIRIKRIHDVPVKGEPVIKRYYYYNGSDVKQPQYTYRSKIRTYCEKGGSIINLVFDEYELHTLTSSSLSSLYVSNKGQQSYGKIIISLGGDDFEYGAVEKEFYVKGDAKPQDYFMHPNIYNLPQVLENNSIGNGILKREVLYKRENDLVIPVKEIKKDYSFNKVHSITNNLRKLLYNRLSGNVVDGDNLYLGLYLTSSYRTDLNFVQINIFNYENIPISGEDINNDNLLSFSELDAQPKVISQQEDYKYDQYVGIPSNKILQTSKSAIKDEYSYLYPEWTSNIITGISNPIKTQLYKNKNGVKELKMTKTYLYSSSFDTYPYRCLSGILVKKGIVSENLGEIIIQFNNYDRYGNPLEVKKTDGPSVVYLWGYSGQYPIAKIENATYQEVATALNTSITGLNAYTEANLGTINSLRSKLPNAQVTTYTYDPLVGISTITDARGVKTSYDY